MKQHRLSSALGKYNCIHPISLDLFKKTNIGRGFAVLTDQCVSPQEALICGVHTLCFALESVASVSAPPPLFNHPASRVSPSWTGRFFNDDEAWPGKPKRCPLIASSALAGHVQTKHDCAHFCALVHRRDSLSYTELQEIGCKPNAKHIKWKSRRGQWAGQTGPWRMRPSQSELNRLLRKMFLIYSCKTMAWNIFIMLVLIKSEGNKSEGNLKALPQGKKETREPVTACGLVVIITSTSHVLILASRRKMWQTQLQITMLFYVP